MRAGFRRAESCFRCIAGPPMKSSARRKSSGEPAVRMSHRLAKRRWTLRRSAQSDEAREESSKDSPKARIEKRKRKFPLFSLCVEDKVLTGDPRIPERHKDAVNARCSAGRGYVTYFAATGVNVNGKPSRGTFKLSEGFREVSDGCAAPFF